MALGSSPNPGIVGKDAMQAIEHDPRHADDAVSEEKAELEAEKAGEPPASAEPQKRSGSTDCSAEAADQPDRASGCAARVRSRCVRRADRNRSRPG